MILRRWKGSSKFLVGLLDAIVMELMFCLRSNCGETREESEEPLMENQKPSLPASSKTPLSYAQAVGPAQQGVKRRFSFSPSDHRPRRSAKFSRIATPNESSPCSEPRPLNMAATPDGTPESEAQKTSWNGFAQRRLFSSPNASPASTGRGR